MNTDNGSHGDLLEGIYPETPEYKAVEKEKKFEPWLKPRKHFIRLTQWNPQIENLIKEIPFQDRPLRYISLPGKDFLDVRSIYPICVSNKLKIRFLGFNDAQEGSETGESDPAVNEITGLALIDDRSKLLFDRFESLYNKNSVAYRQIEDTGPFDILNLDLCNSFATTLQRGSEVASTYYDALLTLIKKQTASRTEPWMFFLTTRCSPECVAKQDIGKFWECIKENMDSSASFAASFQNLIEGTEQEDLLSLNCNLPDQRLHFMRTFCVGLGKWLLQVGQSGNPKWNVSLLKSYYYEIHDPYDMLSVGFRFDRVTEEPFDKSGLCKNPGNPGDACENELQCAEILLKKTEDLIDVDKILEEDNELRDDIVCDHGELLQDAGYSFDGYIDWLKKYNLI